MRKRTNTRHLVSRIPPDMYDALDAIKLRDGIPLSEQLRRALQAWIDAKQLAPVPVAKRGRS